VSTNDKSLTDGTLSGRDYDRTLSSIRLTAQRIANLKPSRTSWAFCPLPKR